MLDRLISASAENSANGKDDCNVASSSRKRTYSGSNEPTETGMETRRSRMTERLKSTEVTTTPHSVQGDVSEERLQRVLAVLNEKSD